MKRSITLLTIIPFSLMLTACGSQGTVTTPEAEEVAVVEQSGEAETVEEETVEEAKSDHPTFGDTYTWNDGLAVTISEPTEFTINEFTAELYDLDAGTPILFDVIVDNGTDEELDSIGFHANALSGGKEAEAVFDTENGVDLPTVKLLPGDTLTYKIAFIVADLDDVRVSWSDLSFDRDQVHFTE